MIIQLLAGANLIDVDFRLKEDRALFSGAQQFFTLIIFLCQATVYMLTGLYGEPSALGAGTCLLLIIQPIVPALIVNIVDKLLQKGTAWDQASIYSLQPTSRSALTGNVFIVSQILATQFPRNLLVKILGVCEHLEDCPQLSAAGGITYYMSQPHTIKDPVLDPIHTAIYIVFMLNACALLNETSIEISGNGLRDVAKPLKDGQISGGDCPLSVGGAYEALSLALGSLRRKGAE
ncbi:hypothetical protein CVT25_000509 [Psilocybe cyanescens]|uniref:Uncharacterized protein n=1 Tax=Psilocybe cyanescens TaxID=93625 RepID=A0A409XWA0_PSICY|nr:hypothetical protein CVT25_000509 [Psilocybe cyanescens]